MKARGLVLIAAFVLVGCFAKRRDVLVTPDEDYAQGTDVTVRVDEIRNSVTRTRITLKLANRLPDPLIVSQIHASLLDAEERAVPLVRVSGGDVCSDCTQTVDLLFDTSTATAGVGELQLTGLPVDVGPILFRMSGRDEPTEPLDGWDVAQRVIGIVVGSILLLGLIALCIVLETDCDGLFGAAPNPLGREIEATRRTECR